MNRTATLQYMVNISEILENKESRFLERLYKRLLQVVNYGKMILGKHMDTDEIIKHLERLHNAKGFTTNRIRNREYVLSRQILATFLMDNTKYSLAHIGSDYFPGYDHATVIHCHKAIDNLIDTDYKFRVMFKTLLKRFDLKYYKYKTGYRTHLN